MSRLPFSNQMFQVTLLIKHFVIIIVAQLFPMFYLPSEILGYSPISLRDEQEGEG